MTCLAWMPVYHMVLNYKCKHVIDDWTSGNYSQYVQSRWDLSTPSMLRAGYPTLFAWRGGGVRFAQAQDQQVTRDVTTRNPRIVTECLLTRAMLIKLYVHVHETVYFGSLVFQFIWLCFFSTVTVTLMTHFGLWTLFSSELKMLNTLVLFTFMMSASPLWNF